LYIYINEWRRSYECTESRKLKNRSLAKLRLECKKIRDGHKETTIREKQWKYYDKINDITEIDHQ